MRSVRTAAALLALLLLTLLSAQWTGMQHRVAHAWISAPGADHAAAMSDDDDSLDLAHSCTLFDAAALGLALHPAFYLPVCLRAAMAAEPPPETSSPQAHPFRHFSPRGPPLV